jgi:hypothetical protein
VFRCVPRLTVSASKGFELDLATRSLDVMLHFDRIKIVFWELLYLAVNVAAKFFKP